MHSKLKTWAKVSKIVQGWTVAIFCIFLLIIGSLLFAGKLSQQGLYLSLLWSLSVMYTILVITGLLMILSWWWQRRAIYHPVLGEWYSKYLSEANMYYDPILDAYRRLEKMKYGTPEYKALSTWLSGRKVGQYQIANFLRIAFVDCTRERVSSKVQFTVFCCPEIENDARKFADFLLSIKFIWPTRFAYTIQVVPQDDAMWHVSPADFAEV